MEPSRLNISLPVGAEVSMLRLRILSVASPACKLDRLVRSMTDLVRIRDRHRLFPNAFEQLVFYFIEATLILLFHKTVTLSRDDVCDASEVSSSKLPCARFSALRKSDSHCWEA
jgi:hypothetical protein